MPQRKQQIVLVLSAGGAHKAEPLSEPFVEPFVERAAYRRSAVTEAAVSGANWSQGASAGRASRKERKATQPHWPQAMASGNGVDSGSVRDGSSPLRSSRSLWHWLKHWVYC